MSKIESGPAREEGEIVGDEWLLDKAALAAGGITKIINYVRAASPRINFESLLPGERPEPVRLGARTAGVDVWRRIGGM